MCFEDFRISWFICQSISDQFKITVTWKILQTFCGRNVNKVRCWREEINTVTLFKITFDLSLEIVKTLKTIAGNFILLFFLYSTLNKQNVISFFISFLKLSKFFFINVLQKGDTKFILFQSINTIGRLMINYLHTPGIFTNWMEHMWRDFLTWYYCMYYSFMFR